jgi:hypothetical protein
MHRVAISVSMALRTVTPFARRVRHARFGFPPPMFYISLMTKYTPIESEFEAAEDEAAYDAWFRAKVEKAMASKEPSIPHDQVMAEMQAIIDKHKNT